MNPPRSAGNARWQGHVAIGAPFTMRKALQCAKAGPILQVHRA